MGLADWGDVPTWIGAGGAIGAAVFAYQTITSQRRQIGEQRSFIAEQSRFMGEQQQNLEMERAELRAAAEDRRSTQARRVRMHERRAGATTDGQGAVVPDDHWVVTAHNESDVPVHDVEVRFGSAHTAAEVHEWRGHWNQSVESRGERLTLPVHVLGPGRAARFLSQHWSPTTLHNNRPTLYFTDDNGVRWMLDSYGKLDEAPAPGAS
ncbi:hypothetical protein [Streptomyces sp. NPDC058335]|uniref:hypothetical protein n=1 Tax=Streptomyces sp. NPDC058335 TaxID=3346451 RepID=UPI00364E5BBE